MELSHEDTTSQCRQKAEAQFKYNAATTIDFSANSLLCAFAPSWRFHKRFLKRLVLSPFDDFLLQVSIHIVEVVAVARHAHQQILVVFGGFLSRFQCRGIDDVELDVMATEGKVAADQLAKPGNILVTLEQTGQEALIEQRTTGHGVIKLGQ